MGLTSGNKYSTSYRNQPALSQQKVKKMGFFKQWLYNKLQSDRAGQSQEPSVLVREESIDQPDKQIRFTVYHANGGRVVQTHRYDRKLDRNHNNLYIITSDKDFGAEIDKIITLESLKMP